MSAPLISDTALWATCARHLVSALVHLADTEIRPRFECARVSTKADGSVVTDADLAVQQALPSILERIYPAPLLGEEMPSAEQSALWRSAQEGKVSLWIADPIDGTANFASGLPWFAISVALMHQGHIVLGATVAPALNKYWHASIGGGCFCNDQAHRLGPQPDRLNHCIVGVDMTYLPHTLRQKIANISPAGIANGDHQIAPWRGWRSLGASTLEWCALATGQIQAYVHGGQMPWDAAAGRLILEEAGGFSLPLCTVLQHPLDVSLCPTGFAAASPGVWPAWQTWLREHQG
jgi:myo-inositol-1(or 4)-monophosphatase